MDDHDTDGEPAPMDRRAFLARGAGAAGVGLGLGSLQDDQQDEQDGGNGQDSGDDEQQLRHKMVVERVPRFERDDPTDDYVGRIVLVTEKADEASPPENLEQCAFDDWDPEGLTTYNLLVIEKAERVVEDINFAARRPSLPTGEVIAEKFGYVARAADDIPPGSGYIINGQVDCPDRWIGVTLEDVPDRLIGPIDQPG